jgi:OPA family glycerol-3-phosphate transporter-like MFS transporter
MMDKFAVEHAEASLPATLFFFAYGVGQIVVGLFCNRFNRKLLVVSALVISGIINLIIFLGANLIAIKYLWMLNGFVQANLWPVMLLILRENLSDKRLTTAGVVMATASTGGKFASIGVCAIFAINTETFMYCFLTASILLFAMAVLFLFTTNGVKVSRSVKEPKVETETQIQTQKPKTDKKSIILLLLMGEVSLTAYAISGGLQQWVPAIIKESYNMNDAISIFMSILLPLFNLTCAVIAPYLNKLLKNYVVVFFLCFVLGIVLLVGVLLCLDAHWLPILILFTVESITMGIIANTTTVEVPLKFKGKFNAGFLAGYLNGACYIGTALATYLLGYMADATGWAGAFILLIAIASVSAILSLIYLLFQIRTKKTQTNLNEVKSSE